MARTVRDAKLQTREQRTKLALRHEPYWRLIDEGQHLGYRKGSRGGTWVARWRPPGGGPYKKKSLGLADDRTDHETDPRALNYSKAQQAAREWFAERNRRALGLDDGSYTVRNAIKDYLDDYQSRGGKSLRTVEYSINAHILPEFGDSLVSELTSAQIRGWHRKLAQTPARMRTTKGSQQQHRCAPSDPDSRRQRQATANKNLTMLKAALNYAFNEDKIDNDTAWRKVKPFKNVDSPRIRYLTEEEAIRLINACEPDFRRLVKGALLTSARYGELTALRVGDFNSDAGCVYIAPGKTEEERYATLSNEGQTFFEEVTAGRPDTERVFLRDDGHMWSKGHQNRRVADACERAKISPSISFHILRHCQGSWLAMRGVPMHVIAKHLGHADDRMTQKHYAHLSPDYVKNTIRDNLPTLGIGGDSKVKKMRRG